MIKVKIKKLIAFVMIFLLMFNYVIPGMTLDKSFYNVMAMEGGGDSTTGSAITIGSPYEIGEYIEGEYISAEYSGVTTSSAISFMSFFAKSDDNDISDKINIDKFEMKIGGKVVFNDYYAETGPEIEVNSTDKFGFDFSWNAYGLDGAELSEKTFTITIGKFKGLPFTDLDLSEKPVNIGIETVGIHKLNYSAEDAEGYRSLSYTINFNDKISLFRNVRGSFGGESTFISSSYNEPVDIIFGVGGKGSITIMEMWVYPIGHGWGPGAAPTYKKVAVIEKSGKSFVNEYKLDWTVKFHDLIAKHQSAPTDESNNKFDNIIIEDTLDRHQEFDTAYNNGLPFKFNIPVLYMYETGSTGIIDKIDITNTDKTKTLYEYNILGGKEFNINLFEEVTDKGHFGSIEENVRKTPYRWAIVVEGEGSESCQKLIINLGPMGDGSPFTIPYTVSEITSKIESDIANVQKSIDEMTTPTESTKWKTSMAGNLENKWTSVYNLYKERIKDDLLEIESKISAVEYLISDYKSEADLLPDGDSQIDKILAKVAVQEKNLEILNNIKLEEDNTDGIRYALEEFNDKITAYIENSKTTVETSLENGISFYVDGESPIAGDILFPQVLVEYSDFIDGEAPIAYEQYYQDFKVSAKNYKANFDKYASTDGLATFKGEREKLIAMYKSAKDFFENEFSDNTDTNGSIYSYGFDMLYGTKLKAESVGKRDVTNEVIIKATGYEINSKFFVDNNYAGGIQGDNRLGDVVLNKIDADTKKPMSGVKFEIFEAGTGGTTGNALKFLSKAEGKYFEYDKSGTVSKLATDDSGKLIIWGIPAKTTDSGGTITEYRYVFSEITPKGYYAIKDVEFQPDYNQVTDVEIKNYKRKAMLVKADEENPDTKLEGAKFEVYRDGESSPLSFKIENGGEYVLEGVASSTEAATSELITNEYGKIIVTGLDAGTYYFKEIKAPKGYYFEDKDDTDNDNKYSFTLEEYMPDNLTDSEKESYIVKANSDNSITNKRIPGKISLTKKGEGEISPLKDIPFRLYKEEGASYNPVESFNIESAKYSYFVKEGSLDTDNKTLLTDSDGKITITGLPWGEYYLQEPWTDYDDTENNSSGNPEPASLKNYAYNETKYYFTIDASSVGFAPNDGKVTDPSIPEGDGNAKLKKGSVTGAEIANNEVVNLKYKGKAELVKFDEYTYVNGVTNTVGKLKGAVFELHKGSFDAHSASCEKIGTTYTTDINGKITTPDLLPGDYHFVEITAPQGYDIINSDEKTEKIIDFNIVLKRGADKKTKQLVSAGDVLNSRKPGEISITKQGNDENGIFTNLANAEFSLYKKDGNNGYKEVTSFNIDPDTIGDSKDKKYTYTVSEGNLKDDHKTLVSDANGKITVKGLPWGEYYLVETKAPEYFTENKDAKYYFKIDAASFSPNTGSNPGKSITHLYEDKAYTVKLTDNIINNIRNTATIELIKYDSDKPATIGGINVSKDTQYGVEDKDKAIECEKIQGATYKLYKQIGSTPDISKDTPIRTSYTTDANGKITVDKLYSGTYYFVETAAPSGYKLDETPIVFNTVIDNTGGSGLISSNYYGFKFAPNEKTKYTVTLNKKDADDQTPLVGVEYELHLGDVHSNNCKAIPGNSINLIAGACDGNVFKTDANGQIKFELRVSSATPIGKYHFAEIKSADGYHLNGGNDNIVNFEIIHSQTSKNDVELSVLNHTNSKVKYGVKLTKYDSERISESKLSNVEFRLYKNDGTPIYNNGGTPVYTETGAATDIWKTDANGLITISDLPLGDYYFVETIPAGYRAPIDEDAYYLKTINAENYGIIHYGSSKNIMFNITKRTDAQTNDTAIYYANIDVVNKRNAGVAILTKYGNGNILNEAKPLKLLNGATFKLYKQSGLNPNINTDTLIDAKTTGDSDFPEGKIIFDGLSWGKYYVVETSAPNGYVIDETIYHTFTVDNSSADTPIDIKTVATPENLDGKIINELYKAGVKLIKKDAQTGAPIQGVTFKLYPKSGIAKDLYNDKFMAEYTTDINGEINILNLPLGEYCFKEISPKDGYYLTDSYKNGTAPELNFEVTKADNKSTVILGDTAENKIVNSKYNVEVLKISSEKTEPNRKLGGAKFWLYNSNKVRMNSVDYVTDTYGKVSLGNMLSGTYYLKEVKAPDGYVLNDEYIEFTLPEIADKSTYMVTVSNMRKPVDAVLKKAGKLYYQSLVPVSGAVFDLYKKSDSGEYIKQDNHTSTTDTEGNIKFNKLQWGDYYVIETFAPYGYILDSITKYTFSINSSSTNSGAITTIKINGENSDGNINPIVNEKYYGKVVLTKKGENDVLLEGVKFELYKNNVLLGEYITDVNGQISVTNLELGNYYFKETKALDEYYISDEAKHVGFEITPANSDVSKAIGITVNNKKIIIEDDDKPSGGGTVKPVPPTEPEKPIESEKPTEPENPTNPEKPVEPENPSNPQTPERPKGPGEITIIKKDENNNPVPDKEYTLYDKDHKEVDRKTTDRDGKVTFTDLDEELYFFEDEDVPGGPIALDLSGEHLTVNVDGNTVRISNLPYTSGNMLANILILIGALLILIGAVQTIIKHKRQHSIHEKI